ncbi:16288_t:CDS:2, partial [Funneliformis caledonium]
MNSRPLPPPALSINNKDIQFLEQETTTLLVKNLPNLCESDLLDFLKHFGPQEIRLGTSNPLKNSAFLDYPDRLSAANAFSKIQELGDVVGKKVRVEYALPSKEALQKKGNSKVAGNSSDNTNENRQDDSGSFQTLPPPPPFPPPPSFIAEPIAPSLGINYPAPPSLHYRYPPPTVEILYNIMNAIAAVPKLYTQVLHLMNKMNLPPPFGPILPESIPALLQTDTEG